MYKITKSTKIAAIFMIVGLGSLVQAVEKVTLVSSDETAFIVDRSIAEQSVTIKNILKDMEVEDAVVPLPNVDAASLRTILGILEEVKNIAPRAIDGQQSPYKIQLVVDSFLGGAAGGGAGGGAGGASFDEIKNIVLAANYLEIPFLINAAARSLVHRDFTRVQNIVQTEDFDTFSAELHSYFQKHLALHSTGVDKEYSIADLIEENPDIDELDAEGKLDLSGLEITDLYGLEYINLKTKSKTKSLDLYNNRLTSIPDNAFQGLNNLKELDLGNNLLISLPANAFQGLNNLKRLTLSGNKLTILLANIFQKLNNLEKLFLSDNLLISLPANAFQGLNNLKELDLGNNRLTSLPDNAFQELNNLERLFLYENRLKSLHANAFQGLHNLKKLYLSRNELTEKEKQDLRDYFKTTLVYI